MVSILRKQKIPFRISGGLAAKVYGSKRRLADIDIDIPEKYFKNLITDVKGYVKFGPAKYLDKNWSLLLMTLKYRGQEIDICGAYRAKIFDNSEKRWIRLRTNFKSSCVKNVFGVLVPVISRKDLISYKNRLSRKVDTVDIGFIKSAAARHL